MKKLDESALGTDFYELTMMQGYFLADNNPLVVFDMFYRSNPFNGGYVVFAGLNDLLKRIESFAFSQGDIDYLASLNTFDKRFLKYLEDFRFQGRIEAVEEGAIVFPGEPLIRVEATLMEGQLIEGMLLNTINFQSLVATKASRIYNASNNGEFMEFGFRRSQGPDGALSASRAAYIGGGSATSNTLAAKVFDIPVAGTMAHSWVMSFESELDSFRAFAEIYPDHTILLIDTYDTLGSGIENAIIVGQELKAKGKNFGVRLDSGDLSYLSREIRDKLDQAGLEKARIYASNDLNEHIIETLIHDNVPIDSWGIGTHLVTGGSQAALNGVYKLAARQLDDGTWLETMKITNTFEKATNPGRKQVWRFFDECGSPLADLITLEEEKIILDEDYVFYHPFSEVDFFTMRQGRFKSVKPLLQLYMEDGKRTQPNPPVKKIQEYTLEGLASFHSTYKRLMNPHIYKVSLSSELKQLKTRLAVEGLQKLNSR